MEAPEIGEASFLGRITASSTHEMKNVLAIIQESSGLMQDLLSLIPEGSFPKQERFARALSSITAQVKRGSEISDKLNYLAHCPDQDTAPVDLGRAIHNMAFLSRRFAAMKRVELSTPAGPSGVIVECSPVHLLRAIFTASQCCWDHMIDGGGTLTLSCSRTEDTAAIELDVVVSTNANRPALLTENTAGLQSARAAVGVLGGELHVRPSGSGLTLVLPVGKEARIHSGEGRNEHVQGSPGR